MDDPKHANGDRTVLREEFLRDPGSTVRRAKAEGPIAITNGDGEPRLVICIPTDPRPEPAH